MSFIFALFALLNDVGSGVSYQLLAGILGFGLLPLTPALVIYRASANVKVVSPDSPPIGCQRHLW